MADARSIIQDALIQIGALAATDSMPAEDAAFGLRELNRMVASWNAEDLMVYTVDRQTFSFVAGQQFYTIGTGGDLNTARPVVIDMASVLVNGVEIPIEILNDEQWRDVTLKTVSSTFPTSMWANGNYPLNTLAFWPIPTAVNTLVLYTWGQLSTFANVNQTVSLPQGYEDALVSNLAVRLSPGYGTQPSPVLLQVAQTAKARLKRINWEPTYRSADSALLGTYSTVGDKSRGYVID